MPKFPTRNKVNYASQMLYTSFDATGCHFTNHTGDPLDQFRNTHWTEVNGGNQVRQLHRVQAVNHSFQTNFVDINEYGQLARRDKTYLQTPDVTIDFEYCLADGYNEQVAGFVIDGSNPALMRHINYENRLFGQNFFVLQGPDGYDIINSNLDNFAGDIGVVGVGNAYLSQYAVTAEVGSLPKARMSFEAANMRSYTNFKNQPVPSLNFKNECLNANVNFSIPDTYESFLYEHLKGIDDIDYKPGSVGVGPSDLRISLDGGGHLSKQLSSINDYSDGSAHIQGFTINATLGSTKLNRIGTSLEFSRSYNFPMRIEVQVRALLANLRSASSLCDLFQHKRHNLVLLIEDPRSVCECDGTLKQEHLRMAYYIKGAVLDTEAFSSAVGDNKVVDLNFHCQVGGPEDQNNGMFIFGSSYFPDRPRIVSWGRPIFT